MKPAAKLVGSIKSNQQGMVKKNDTLDKMKTVLDWFHDRELDYTTGFMRYGVRYQNGRLIVPLTGTYNIYSFLSLTENNDFANVPVQITNRTEVKHSIYKYNVKLGKDIELASSLQTHRRASNLYFNAFSSQISLLVQLEAGDEISVKLSDLSLTSYPSDNYFGLHMI
ncbi:tumor necrosis factor ligand superfamily member 15-like isoform X4 [Dreissena polymorpha]|nr:tumor necrosis factor ligand superfamily member 15-like isoform X4 [Dreissena polymorpha]